MDVQQIVSALNNFAFYPALLAVILSTGFGLFGIGKLFHDIITGAPLIREAEARRGEDVKGVREGTYRPKASTAEKTSVSLAPFYGHSVPDQPQDAQDPKRHFWEDMLRGARKDQKSPAQNPRAGSVHAGEGLKIKAGDA